MLKYSVSQSTNDNFLITILEDGDYKGVIVNIVDLKFNESGELDFEIELPKNKVELFNDEKFKDEVSLIVGDVVKKSVEEVWKTREAIEKIEETIDKKLEEYQIKREKNKLIVEQFMEKGYLLRIDNSGETERIMAVDIKNNIQYDMSLEADLRKLANEVYKPNIILN